MKNSKIWKFNIIYFTTLTLVAVVFFFGHLGCITNEIFSSFLIQVVVMFAVPLLMLTMFNKQSVKKTLSDCGFKKISLKMIGISVLIGVVLYLINSFVASFSASIISLLGYESLSSSTPTDLSYSSAFKDLILSCILPGICEEFIHRGVMVHAQSKHTNKKYCLIVSSILFGLAHLNIRQFLYAGIMGFFIGYIGIVSRSIYPCMIVHFMNNFLSTYFVYGKHLNWPFVQLYEYILNIIYSNSLMFVSTSFVAVIGLFYLYKYLCKVLLKSRAKYDVSTTIQLFKAGKISEEQTRVSIENVNNSLKNPLFDEKTTEKSTFFDKIPLICSFVLGFFITISSFIWGII